MDFYIIEALNDNGCILTIMKGEGRRLDKRNLLNHLKEKLEGKVFKCKACRRQQET